VKFVCVAGLLALTGCAGARDFGRGFRDTGAQMAGEIAADQLAEIVEAKLGDDFKDVSEALGKLPSQLPQPPGPVDQGLMYSLGGLLAYIVGSFGKGALRKVTSKKA
jgi:hypothetical protein